MSKLLEKIKQATQSTYQPLGFGTHISKPKAPPIMIVASIPQTDVELISALQKGADALLLPVSSLRDKAKGSRQVAATGGELPCGILLEAASDEDIKLANEAGCDFLVFRAEGTSAALLNEEDLGKVLTIEPTLEEELVRTLEELPVDAVFIAGESHSSLSVHQIMLYSYLGGVAGKPLLIPASLEISESALESLVNAGIVGIVVEAKNTQECERVAEIRKTILSIPERERGPKSKPRPVIPTHLMHAEMPSIPEEEEEQDE